MRRRLPTFLGGFDDDDVGGEMGTTGRFMATGSGQSSFVFESLAALLLESFESVFVVFGGDVGFAFGADGGLDGRFWVFGRLFGGFLFFLLCGSFESARDSRHLW